MAASAGRHPVSAQCRILGVPRPTYCHVPAGPPGAYSGRGPRPSRPAAPPDAANAPGGGLDGRRPRTHVAADLAYVRAGSRRCHVCLLVDLCNREVVGCSCGWRKDAPPVRAAFSNAGFPLTAIEMFHSDRGAESCNAEIDALLTASGIEGSASRPGNPREDAVAESTNHILKREPVAGRRLGSEEEPRAAPLDWADWHDNLRIHSTLGYMSPVEFREAGPILS